MLNKTYFLATILLLALILSATTTQAQAWQTTTVQAILSPKTLLTSERWRLSPWGIEIPIETAIDHTNQCYQPLFHKFLKVQILDKPIQVKGTNQYESSQLYRTGRIKFSGQYDLAEFLLAQGWARLSKEDLDIPKTYQAAQARARESRLGLWGECDHWHEIRQKLKRDGQNPWQTIPNKSLLKSTGIGWVKTVLAPNLIELDSGQKIKLQGLDTPSPDSPLFACWKKSLLPALKLQWQGQKVLLEKDHLQLDLKDQALQRYVWMPANRWQSKRLLNAWMITEGMALLEETDLNLKNIEAMHQGQAQFKAKKVPPTWWQQCLGATLKAKTEVSKKSQNDRRDETCPIKGNIAGSKKNPKLTYHTPASGWYQRIKHEQCFKSEAEAEEAGFVKVK